MSEMMLQITSMQNEAQETKKQLASTREENRILNNTMVTGLGTLPDLVKTIKEGQKSSGSHKPSLIDQRGLGKPTVFPDKEDKFAAWMRKTENYIVGVFGEEFRQVLIWAAESDSVLEKKDWVEAFGPGSPDAVIAEIEEKVNQVYTVLISLTEDETNEIVVGAGSGNGLEAWRLVVRRWDPSTGGRKRNLLKAIIAPQAC